MGDARVPMSAVERAFGAPCTVTRPAPLNLPVSMTCCWYNATAQEPQPYGSDLYLADPWRYMVIRRTRAIDHIPKGTLIQTVELGETATWEVAGYEGTREPDLMRLKVKRTADW